MKSKTLEALNSDLFLLSAAALLQTTGGLRYGASTRIATWCDRGDYQDMDGYMVDWTEDV